MSLKNKFYAPTPAKWRKIGDALLGVSSLLGTYSVADDWGKGLTIAIILTGALGKFITNLFSE